MKDNQKQLIFVAGPNGAGKTTSAFLLLPDFFKTNEFVNADEIARGLSPFNAEAMAVKAGKIMLSRVRELIKNDKSFGIETTLAGRTYQSFIMEAKKKGYKVGIIFLYLRSISLAQKRVEFRVAQGGHNIPEDVIERRYNRGLTNLVKTYLPLADWTYVFDNSAQSEEGPTPIYFQNGESVIANKELWEKINEQA